MTSRFLLFGALTVSSASLLVSSVPVVSAHPLPSSASATDEDMYIERGVALRKKGDDEAALHEFRHAYEVSKSGRALAQVALAEQALGHWVDAEAHLLEALTHDREPWIVRNRAPLSQSLSDIKEQLGSLEISGGVPRAEVRLNGQPVGVMPLAGPLRVQAGTVAIEVKAPGYLPVLRTVMVSAKGHAREQVVMVPVASAEPDVVTGGGGKERGQVGSDGLEGGRRQGGSERDGGATPTAAGGWSGLRITGLVMGSAGLAAAGAGFGFYLQRQDRASAFNLTCNYDPATSKVSGASDCIDKYNRIITSERWEAVSLVAGGVLVAAGVTLFILGGRDEASGGHAHSATPRWACAPSAGLGASCAMTF